MNYLVAGLGNPGKEYVETRHNAGFVVLDHMYPNIDWSHDDYAKGDVAQFEDGYLLKPTTFMNVSGESVQYFIDKKGITPENVIVIYDDIDLPLGKIKISFDRGNGGHNGIKSIEEHVGGRNFIRIRIGISKTLEDGRMIKPNVLGKFEPDELKILESVAKTIEKALKVIQVEGKEKAMTEFNQ